MELPIQKFGGYADVVGNFTQGQDISRQRAQQDFAQQQQMKAIADQKATQDTLLLLNDPQKAQGFKPQSYPEFQAVQMHAKQFVDTYNPTINMALETGNMEAVKSIAQTYRQSGNPMLGKMADVIDTISTTDGKEYDFTLPAINSDAEANAIVKFYPSIAKIYPSSSQIPRGIPLAVKTQGSPLSQGARVHSVEPKATAVPKVGTETVDIKSEDQIAALEAQYADDPEALPVLAQARQLLAESPAGVSITLPSKNKLGVKAKAETAKEKETAKTEGTKEREEAKAGVKAAVDFPMESAKHAGELLKRDDLSETVKASLRSMKGVAGQRVEFGNKVDGKYTSIKILPPKVGKGTGSGTGAGSGGGGGAFPVMKYNDKTKYYGSLFKKNSGETEFATLVSRYLSAQVGGRNPFNAIGLSAGKQNDSKREEFVARVSDYMAQFGITQEDLTTSAGATKAIGQLQKQQSRLEGNASVAEKGFQMLSDLRKKGQISTNVVPMLNHVENTLRNWSGDALPGAAQGVLTETLVDYAKVVSGRTSTAGVTQYAATLARELMELKDNPAQFQAKVDQYAQFMKSRLSGGRAMLKGLAKVTDVGNKGKPNVAPAGTRIQTKDGKVLVSDGQGGWK